MRNGVGYGIGRNPHIFLSLSLVGPTRFESKGRNILSTSKLFYNFFTKNVIFASKGKG